MSTDQLRDLLLQATDGLETVDLGPRVHSGVRVARRRRRAAGSVAVVAVIIAWAFAVTRPASTGEGTAPSAPSPLAAVPPSAAAPVPTAPVVTQPAGAIGQPATYAYFRVIAVAHQAAQVRLVVVTARGDRIIGGVERGNAMELSPDGLSLAITGSSQDPRWQLPIRIVDLRTGVQRTLTSTSTNAQPGWSPDSRYVAYQGELSGGIVDVRSGALMSTRSLIFGAGPVSWSPDGKRLAGNMGGPNGHTGIMITTVDLSPGSDISRSVHFTSLPGQFSILTADVWSPDGSRLYVYDLTANKPHEQNEVISASDGHVISRNAVSPWAPWQNASVLSEEHAALPADHREVAYRPTT